MKHLRFALFLCLFAASFLHARDVFFKSDFILWKDAEILIWSNDPTPAIDPKEFCLSLKRNNMGIGDPKCRILGEWERDSVAVRYANWLNNNLEPNLKSEYLKARHPAMMAKFQTLEDRIIVYTSKKDNQVQIAIFDETASEPKAAGIFNDNNDKIALGDEIASTFFDGPSKRRLSKDERRKLQTEPDDYYQEVPDFTAWVGLGIGYSQAQIPLTPDDWYRSHINSQIKRYRVTKDSTSLWNFIDDSDPFLLLYVGGTWYGFIGAEVNYRFATHHAKTDETDTIYRELDHWDFYQHEIGLSVHLSRTYPITNWMDITPFVYLGFQYSFFVEDIALKDGIKEPSREYKSRIQFEEAYKGAILGIGSQFVFAKHYGLGLRTGISSRGRNIYSDPSPDAAAEPSTIGGSTIDWFICAGLEYHWNL